MAASDTAADAAMKIFGRSRCLRHRIFATVRAVVQGTAIFIVLHNKPRAAGGDDATGATSGGVDPPREMIV